MLSAGAELCFLASGMNVTKHLLVLQCAEVTAHLQLRLTAAQRCPLLDEGSKEAEIGPLQGIGARTCPLHLWSSEESGV